MLRLPSIGENNVVTPVKNQDTCGSCYTFSTVGNIESQYAIRNKEILDLSEQQILSCGQNNGCAGGLMTVSMQYVIDNAGIEEESDYPYENAKTTCKFNPQLAKVTLSGCKQYFLTDEEKLKEILYKDGPIAVAIASSDILNYHGGVQKMCGGGVDHAVLLVGYGTDKFEGDYWILKNSWASTWGEQGFIRIARGSNTCSIMNNLMSSAILA